MLDAARDGDGGAVTLAGPAGIGKTRLLRETVAVARDTGFEALTAQASELEQGFAFGVVQGLIGHDGARPPATTRPVDLHARLHEAYWSLAERAASHPVLVCVDDVQWADDESLRWLAYVVRRLDGLAVAVVTAQRDGEGDASILTEVIASVLRPSALTRDAVAQLAGAVRGAAADPATVDEWHRRSGGNPFLAAELIRAPEDQPLPDSVERNLQTRLRRLGPDATAFAQAASILGSGAPLRVTAELAGLSTDQAARAADRLRAAGLIENLARADFVHALIAEAVAATMPDGERAIAHRRAAQLLDADGGAPTQIAAHVAVVPPAGDDWAAAILTRAGEDALRAGAAQSAARLLRRALAEPAPVALRPSALLSLGRAEAAIRADSAPDHLRAARDALAIPADRAQVTQELVSDLRLRGRVPEAVAELRGALGELSAADLELRRVLEAQLAAAVLGSRETLALAPARIAESLQALSGDTPGQRMTLAAGAFRRGMAGGTGTEAAVQAARRALEGGLLQDVSPAHQLFVMSLAVLYLTGAQQEFERWASAGIDMARRTGSVAGFALVSCFRAEGRRQAGRLIEAEADARAAAAPGDPHTWPMAAAALGFLVETLVERGALADAETALRGSVVPAEALDTYPLCRIRLARGKLALAQGKLASGLEDVLAAGEVYTAWGVLSPAWTDWRSTAARGLAAAGERDRALALVAEELELGRRTGVGRAIGLAQLTAGAITADVATVAEAVDTLAGTEARLVHAQALIELGTLRAAAGETEMAIELLEHGLEAADRCGAMTDRERARRELARLGRRPRRAARHGVEALTAQERRIAVMAAAGRSNREIAQALFVTLGTVEAHLTRAYQKLGVRGRRDLAERMPISG